MLGYLKEQVARMAYCKVRDEQGITSQNATANAGSGEIVKASWEKSELPDAVLSHVWNLADTEQRGALSTTEFIIAMHLLTSYKNKTLTALPQTIPAGLYEAASRRPGPVPTRTPAGPIPRQTSGPSAVRASAGPFTPPGTGTAEWLIRPREKVGYDNLFDKVDTAKLGYVSGDQAVVFFSESGLPSEVLAQIWDLANIRRQDQLNRDEFAVAMYLIRNQGRKPAVELSSELPANLIPPSLRGMLSNMPTGMASETRPLASAPVPAPAPAPAPALAPAPPKSNTDDLFGLDAFTSSPTSQVMQQTTGSSNPLARSSDLSPFGDGSSPRSPQHAPGPVGDTGFFKSFAPTSSFGQALATQSTGASVTSSTAPAPKQTSLMDDLLGDNDPEISKKFTKDTSDFANMQNEIGTLRTQMQAVQNKKAVAENELASSGGQKRELEVRLQQFRAQYEREVKSLKDLEEKLSVEKAEANQLAQKVALLQANIQDVQSKYRDVQSQLENSQREKETVQQRLRQMNEYINQNQPEIEKMQSELRHQKGLLTIHKKQAEKLEEEKGQLDKMKAELADLSKVEGAVRPNISREVTTGSAVSPSPSVASSTNPFMRRSPQASIDNTMSPSGFKRTMSQEGNKLDNIFSQAFSSPVTTAPAPSTSLRQEAFSNQSQSGPSIKSSEPDVPTPSTSPPLSSYQESPQLPAPPPSGRITSKDLPFGDKSRELESTTTSVRVETPLSRYDVSTPTNPISSSPQQPSIERAETSRSGISAGESLFDRSLNASSPVASASSEATKKSAEPIDMFQNLGPSREVQPNQNGGSASQIESPSATRTDPFSFPTQSKASTGSKGDIDAAFASIGKGQNRQALSGGDPVAKFNSEFPPISMKEEFPPIPKKEEFPPIKDLEADESESDSDGGGFADNFTKASPPANKTTHETARTQPSAINDLDSFFSKPSAGSTGGLDFGTPLSPVSKLEAIKSTTGSGSQGEALFGSKSSTSATGGVGSNSMFSTSPPETNRTSNQSDTFESAVSHQSSTNKEFSPTESTVPQIASNAPKFSSNFDDFSGFEDLADAKEVDERADEDLLFGSHHGDDHEFSPSFDSPSASASQLPKSSALPAHGNSSTAGSKAIFAAEDAFGDFDHNFSKSTSSQAQASVPTKPSTHDWDAIMKGIEVDDHEEHSILPEAPEPPRPNISRVETTEHDDPILKRLTSMGYPRPLALSALEKFDYDLDKVSSCPLFLVERCGS
jgi:epidermal growth factor receptor substrate 15